MAVESARSWACIVWAVRYVSRKKPPSSGCGSSPNSAITSSAVGRIMAVPPPGGESPSIQPGIRPLRHINRVIAAKDHLRRSEVLVHDRLDEVGLPGHEVKPAARAQHPAGAFDEQP